MSGDEATTIPAELDAALARRSARIVEAWAEADRHYLVADSPEGRLFARHSSSAAVASVLAHEARVRTAIGSTGELRSPAVLERGPSWLLEVGVEQQPFTGSACIGPALAAAKRLATIDLPSSPEHRVSRLDTLRHRAQLVRSPVKLSDLAAARRVLRASRLPLVTSHGDFHPRNLLFDGSALWVIDWELSGRRPAGYDLMYLWATVADEDDRDRLFDGALEIVGREREHNLRALRYAVTVRVVVGLFAAERDFDRDAVRGAAMLDLLPSLRADARQA